MSTSPVTAVAALIVNHNTSSLAELALRSLLRDVDGDGSVQLSVTVTDNHSDDAGVASLRDACQAAGADFVTSGFPLSSSRFNSHGDIIAEFVLAQSTADYLLLVDSDTRLDDPRTIKTMVDDLASDPGVWAVQARFRSTEDEFGTGASLDIAAGSAVEDIAVDSGFSRAALDAGATPTRWLARFDGTVKPRCHPACTLLEPSGPVLRAFKRFGASSAAIVSHRTEVAGVYDTLGLVSAVLEVAGLRYRLSRATVTHLFHASFALDDVQRDAAARRASDLIGRTEPLRAE